MRFSRVRPVLSYVVAGLLLAVGPADVSAQSFQEPGVQLPNVTPTTTLTTADLNDDGHLDLLMSGENDDNDRIRSVYLGDGKGSFTAAGADLPTTAGATSVGDIDEDENLDVVIIGNTTGFDSTAIEGSDVPGVYLGDGTGGFSKTDVGLDNLSLASTSLADVNGDDHLDLLVSGEHTFFSESDFVTKTKRETLLYLGDGNGGFDRANAGLLGYSEGTSAIADFDGDGSLDLFVTGKDTSDNTSATLYTGDGSGGFSTLETSIDGTTRGTASVGDVNEDGRPDLLLTGEVVSDGTPTDTTTTLYLSDGESGFTTADANLTDVTLGSTRIKDVDGDGHLDLLVTGETSGAEPGVIAQTVSLYLGDGTGAFTEADVGLDDGANSVSAVEDFNEDGSQDVLLSGFGNSILYRGDGQGGFLLSRFPGLDVGSTAKTADFNGDGNLDLFYLGNQSEEVYLGNGEGFFRPAGDGLLGMDNGTAALADFDGDGHLDIVTAGLIDIGPNGEGTPTTRLYLGDGQGTFSAEPNGLVDVFRASLAVADFNDDGHPDLFLTGDNGSGVIGGVRTKLYLNDGDGSFTDADLTQTLVTPEAAWAGDFNNDGHPDVLTAKGGGTYGGDQPPTLLEGDGEGGLLEASLNLPNTGSVFALGDVNGDGHADYLTDNTLYLGDGDGGFSETDTGISDLAFRSASFWDANNDGHLDLLVRYAIVSGDRAGDIAVRLYTGDGTGSFTDAGPSGVTGRVGTMGDINNDGHLDLITDTRIYENTAASSLVAASSAQTVSTDGPADFGDTGIDVDFTGTDSSGTVTVRKYADGPDGRRGIAESNVSTYRFVLSAGGPLSFDAQTQVRFDVSTLAGVGDASNVTVYRRPTAHSGLFRAVPTSYDSGDNELVATTGAFSEFVLASDSEPLPVELSSFDANAADGSARLTWTTASETNNAGFEIQKKTVKASRRDASTQPSTSASQNWKTLGFVEGTGTTAEAQSYRFTADALSVGTHEFRLKQVDTDGSTHLSKTVTAEIGLDQPARLTAPAPNPVQNQSTLSFAVKEPVKTTVTLYNVLGQQVATLYRDTPTAEEAQTVDLSAADLSSGVYFLRLRAGETTRTRRLTVVK